MQRQRRSHNKMVGGALLQYNQIPYLLGGLPTNWKIIISQKFSHRSESSEPHFRVPSLGVWHWGEKPPEHLTLKASRDSVQELHTTGENRFHSKRVYTRFHVHGDTGQSSDSIGAWAKPTCGSWRVSWGGQGWLWLTVGTRTL